MKKQKTVYTCQQCGLQSPKWLGRCPDCQQWNTLVEEVQAVVKKNTVRVKGSTHQRLDQVDIRREQRVCCGITELDRVFGGGVIPGSLTLIGGDPGIGKSTLLLQASARLAGHGKALYVTAEESARQVRLRADRLGVTAEELYLLAETSLEVVFEQVRELKPAFLVIDSIQTIFTGELDSAPGSVSQVRECASQLMHLAKREGVSTFLVGHVTKEGSLAGPRMLEHLVDTVLYFEGDPGHAYRVLRAVKNRYGSTNEIGVFEMKDQGLREVENPSEMFLAERPRDAAGSVVVPSLEGTRPILVELQALVSGTSYGNPRRTTMGLDHNRVSLLVAVLEKKAGLSLLAQDIFVNVAGGVRLAEPAVDLGITAALVSSHLNRVVPPDTILFGEVGLTGEVRAVSHPELRVHEASRLGFKRCLLPSGSARNLDAPKGLELAPVQSIDNLIEALFNE